MADYYVGESIPPPLPPPRKTPYMTLMSRDTPIKEEYEIFVHGNTPNSNTCPSTGKKTNVLSMQNTPPPLPKRSPRLSPSKTITTPPSVKASTSSVKRSSSYDTTFTSKSLPPLPKRNIQSASSNASQDNEGSDEDYESVEIPAPSAHVFEPHPSDGMSLLKFINQNQEHFPVAFEVSLGFSARSEEASISEGERFIANFLKRSKVLTVEDDNKELYTVPLNTSFQFALLYDPNDNKKEAMVGFIFKTAGDLMITRTLPKVIRARRAFRGVSPESSVIVNELLYVKEVVQKEGNRRYVKCVQAATGKEKQLHEECAGEFSTSPHDIRDYLPNLLKHFQLPFRAVMCLGIDNEEDIPSHLVSGVVNVCNLRTEESLITTTITDDSDDNDFSIPENDAVILNDIPLSYDINVKTLQFTPLNAEKVLNQTDFIFNNFNPASVFPYMATHSSSQLALMKSVRKEYNMQGVELLEVKSLKNLHNDKNKTIGNGADSSVIVAELNDRIAVVESQQTKFSQHIEDISKQVKSVTSDTNNFVTYFKQECAKLQKEITTIAAKVQLFNSSVQGIIVIMMINAFIILYRWYSVSKAPNE